jgi:hypothetical protein
MGDYGTEDTLRTTGLGLVSGRIVKQRHRNTPELLLCLHRLQDPSDKTKQKTSGRNVCANMIPVPDQFSLLLPCPRPLLAACAHPLTHDRHWRPLPCPAQQPSPSQGAPVPVSCW